MVWTGAPGSGDTVMASGDTLATGTMSAQSARVGFLFIGSPTTAPTSHGNVIFGNVPTIPASGDIGTGEGALYVQSGSLFFLGGLGLVTKVASA